MPEMIFIVPVYNNADETKNFIEQQLLPQTFRMFEVYVVMNATQKEIAIADNRVKIVYPGNNLGYLGGLRWVIDTLKPSFTYITLCNTDLDLHTSDFLQHYIAALNKETFAIAGPLIQSALTDSAQNPIYTKRISDSKLKRLSAIYSSYPAYISYQTLFYIKNKITKRTNNLPPIHPYALHGSFITLSHLYFEKGGTLQYPVFLFGEELFFAEESMRIGLPTLLVTTLQITHREHSTTGIYKSRQHVQFLKQSVEYIYKTYYANQRH